MRMSKIYYLRKSRVGERETLRSRNDEPLLHIYKIFSVIPYESRQRLTVCHCQTRVGRKMCLIMCDKHEFEGIARRDIHSQYHMDSEEACNQSHKKIHMLMILVEWMNVEGWVLPIKIHSNVVFCVQMPASSCRVTYAN